jgi:uncharacterized protein YlxW (UPF0749 family)
MLGARRAARGGPPRRLDESMTLLREVMERPLDAGYAAAAARRAAGVQPSGRVATVLVATLAALAVTWSVVVLRAPEPEAVRDRAALAEQIEQRTRDLDAARSRMAGYRRDIRRAQGDALNRSGDAGAVAAASTLGIVSGEVAVTGPGVRIELDDAPGSRGGGSQNPRASGVADDGRVYDRDLQTVVNGLWNAGAEAISINDQRLTSLSAIRSAGEAILVDFRPLVPPYTILAIGDPRTVQTRFAADAAGAYLQSLSENFGVRVRQDAEPALSVPGAGSLVLRAARPLPAPTAIPSGSGSSPPPSDRSSSSEATP